MAVKAGSFSNGATGDLSITGLTFLPTNVQFSLGARFGTTETASLYCRGWMTASNQSYDCSFADTSGAQSKAGTDKCLTLYARVSGTITKVMEATFVSFDTLGGGTYGFTINFTAASSNYQVRYLANDA